MPTYDYKCRSCPYTEEHFHSMNEAYVIGCPDCHTTLIRKISGGLGLLFKGSGFYVNDYQGK